MSARDDFDRKTEGLVGRRVDDVAYWDIHNFSDEPREWDFGDWHHALMGVEVGTSAGPVSVLWTNTFYPYGVEVFSQPMKDFLILTNDGPERWAVTDHPEWRSRAGHPVLAVDVYWEQLEVCTARSADEREAEPAETIEVPVALRLDFAASPVWFVAGIPTEEGGVFIPGDEIVVMFSSEGMLRLGFPSGPFTAVSAP